MVLFASPTFDTEVTDALNIIEEPMNRLIFDGIKCLHHY